MATRCHLSYGRPLKTPKQLLMILETRAVQLREQSMVGSSILISEMGSKRRPRNVILISGRVPMQILSTAKQHQLRFVGVNLYTISCYLSKEGAS